MNRWQVHETQKQEANSRTAQLCTEITHQMAASDAFSNIPDFQKPDFIRHLEEQQMKDSLKMYNHLVETCFDKCVTVGWGGVSVQQ